MKRIALYIGMAAAALVASCSVQEKDFKAPQMDDVVFYASFEQPAEGTRVYANEDLLLRWNAEDWVSIFNKNTYNQQYMFLGETGDNAGGFSKVDGAEYVTGNPISHVVSVYPYQEGTKITEDEILTLTLPSRQHYADNTFGLGANMMVSVSSDNFLQYKNACGYLLLRLYGEGILVSSIKLKGNNGEKLAGKATVTMPLNGIPAVTLAGDATDEITLVCNTPVALGATAQESKDFWFVVPPVTFSKGFTVSVNQTSGGVFEKSTSKSITIGRNNLSKMSPMEVEKGTPVTPVPEAIDLGLPSGLKWASINLGATSPEEHGDYFAWGETEPYYESGYSRSESPVWKTGKEAGYDWPSYKWCMDSYYTLTKYCSDSSYGYNGFTDNKNVLDPEDDAAHVILSGNWRMPTDAEWDELITNCTSEWTSMKGVDGRMVTGPNGNSIFLPADGWRVEEYLEFRDSFGEYWSSSLSTDYPISPRFVSFTQGSSLRRSRGGRSQGYSIRPVYGEFISVESMSMNKTSLSLLEDSSEQLTVTISPTNATEKTVTWTSSNPSVAGVVLWNGIVVAISPGTATITAWASDGVHYATCDVTVTATSTVATPEAVDLGLPSGLKWASFNLGASKPEEYGDYYAWGETEPYYSSLDPLIWKEGKESGYDWPSYKWCMGSYDTLTKYCSDSSYGYNGFTDDKTVLDSKDDAASVNLGGKWRMPTDTEWTELRTKCTWTWMTRNGVGGMLVTGSNGNSIFLPAAGRRYNTNLDDAGSYGNYWSSSLSTDFPYFAWSVHFSSGFVFRFDNYRYYGHSVRPVTE